MAKEKSKSESSLSNEKIEWIAVKDIKPHPKNRNQHSEEQIERLAKIIRYQNWRVPLIVSRQSTFLVAGHGRLLAAKKLGIEKVPVLVQDFIDEDQEAAFRVSDNEIARWAELDLSGLNEDIADFSPDFDVDLFGIDGFEIDVADKYGDKDGDDVPVVRKTEIVSGDLFQLGPHRILCGDSTSEIDVGKLMNGEKADFTITSPPYNVGLSYNEYDDKKSEEDYEKMLLSVMKNCKGFGTDDYWLLWNVGVYPLSLHLHLLRQFFTIRRSIAWVKQGITGPPMMYHMQQNPVVKNYSPNFGWEIIACCHVNEKKFGTKKIPVTVMDDAMTDVWQISQHRDSRDQGKHPGAFPVALPERAIQLYAEDIVYEPFSGSGSTLIACEKTQRRFYGMELDPVYVQLCIDRWEKFTGLKAKKIEKEKVIVRKKK